MDVPALRRILLDLVGTARVPALGDLSELDWQELDRIAAMHRLQPLLHARHGRNPALPVGIGTSWRAAHRLAAITALAQRADLARTAGLLAAEGYAPVALKGSWLARHAYPEAAQRPMRDIDLLVRREQVLGAFEALLGAGYTQLEPAEMPLDAIVRLDKHMPPLRSPGGTVIELHHRLWEPDGRLEHTSPTADEGGLHARVVIAADGIRYLAPADLLTHLIVHAVYIHRLDCGPLLLPDIAHLLSAAPVNWAEFWAAAREQGWRDGARLVLALVAWACPDTPIDFAPDSGTPPPAELLAAVPDLLLQELETRASAHLAAAALKDGGGRLFARARGRRGARGEAAVTREMGHEGGLAGWALSRSWRTLRDLSRRDARRQSRQLAALSTWLDR
jgi:Uncharacterised nucleotidyltransferase